jgi:two-component system sensor histidine kinase RpfC
LPVILTGLETYPGELRERSSDSVFVLTSPLDRGVLFNTLHACYSRHSTEDDVIHIASRQLKRGLETGRQLSVLIGDDNATNRLVLERMLAKMGHQCKSVSGGLEVLGALETGHYDLVIVDKNMPDMGGIDVFTACSMAHSGNPPARFIVLTADATAESRDACRAAGIEHFLTKPVSMVQLQETMARAMADVAAAVTTVAADAGAVLGSQGNADPVVDDEEFARLEILAGDNRNFMRDIVHNFEKDARRDIQCLESAVAGHDWHEFIDCAHALKGAAVYLGLVQLAALCTEAQHVSKDGFDREGVAWLQEIREASVIALEALNSKLSASLQSGNGSISGTTD